MSYQRFAKLFVSFFLALIVVISALFSLAACGGGNEGCKYSNEEILVEVANAFERRGSYI